MENRKTIGIEEIFNNLSEAIREDKGNSYSMDTRANLPANIFRGGLLQYCAIHKIIPEVDTIILTGEQVKPGIFNSSTQWSDKQFTDFMSLINETKIKNLDLQSCQLTPSIGVVIGNALKTNTSLERLAVTSSQIGKTGLIAIFEGLMNNSTLKELNSRSYNVSRYYWDQDELISLAKLISTNKTLQEIYLPDNQISKPSHIHILKNIYAACDYRPLATISGFELSLYKMPKFNRENYLNGQLDEYANIKFKNSYEL